jgi:hypothetical protein
MPYPHLRVWQTVLTGLEKKKQILFMRISLLFTGNKELMTKILANNDAYSLSVCVRKNTGDTLLPFRGVAQIYPYSCPGQS